MLPPRQFLDRLAHRIDSEAFNACMTKARLLDATTVERCALTQGSMLGWVEGYVSFGEEEGYQRAAQDAAPLCHWYGYALGLIADEREPAPSDWLLEPDDDTIDRFYDKVVRFSEALDFQPSGRADRWLAILVGLFTDTIGIEPILSDWEWKHVCVGITFGMAVERTEAVFYNETVIGEAEQRRREYRNAHRHPRHVRPTISDDEVSAQRQARHDREAEAVAHREADRLAANERIGQAYAAVLTAKTPDERKLALTQLRQVALDVGDTDTAAEAKRQLRDMR